MVRVHLQPVVGIKDNKFAAKKDTFARLARLTESVVNMTVNPIPEQLK